MVCATPELLLMSPVRIRPLPPRVKAPAPPRKLMPLNEVPTAKSLLVVRFVTPPNWSASPAAGRTSQLPALFQLPLPPPPLQVDVPARETDAGIAASAAARMTLLRR